METYSWPTKTTIVICLDGSEPDQKGYIDTAISMGLMPFMKSMISKINFMKLANVQCQVLLM